jgi:hypothetical protein
MMMIRGKKKDWKSVKKKLYLPIKDDIELKRRNDDDKVGDGKSVKERAHDDIERAIFSCR